MTERKVDFVTLLVVFTAFVLPAVGFEMLGKVIDTRDKVSQFFPLLVKWPAEFSDARTWITLVVLAIGITGCLRNRTLAIGITGYGRWLRNKTHETSEKMNRTFTTRWSFYLSLLSKMDEADPIIDHIEEIYLRDIEKFGSRKARALYRKNVLVSIWPVVMLIVRRLIALDVINRLIR